MHTIFEIYLHFINLFTNFAIKISKTSSLGRRAYITFNDISTLWSYLIL